MNATILFQFAEGTETMALILIHCKQLVSKNYSNF